MVGCGVLYLNPKRPQECPCARLLVIESEKGPKPEAKRPTAYRFQLYIARIVCAAVCPGRRPRSSHTRTVQLGSSHYRRLSLYRAGGRTRMVELVLAAGASTERSLKPWLSLSDAVERGPGWGAKRPCANEQTLSTSGSVTNNFGCADKAVVGR